MMKHMDSRTESGRALTILREQIRDGARRRGSVGGKYATGEITENSADDNFGVDQGHDVC